MIGLPPSTRVFLCLPATDMSKSFDGLAALAVDVVRQEPLSGHLFVFRNRREDRIKVLYWDRTGFCLLSAWNRAPSAFHVGGQCLHTDRVSQTLRRKPVDLAPRRDRLHPSHPPHRVAQPATRQLADEAVVASHQVREPTFWFVKVCTAEHIQTSRNQYSTGY